jgi:hypothetical protein
VRSFVRPLIAAFRETAGRYGDLRIGAIDLLIRLMPPENAELDATDGLLLLREDIRNPKLRARGAQWGHTLARALGRRLSNDQHQVERLGWQMAAVWQGAHT